jgi:hypothetical protein
MLIINFRGREEEEERRGAERCPAKTQIHPTLPSPNTSTVFGEGVLKVVDEHGCGVCASHLGRGFIAFII